VKIGSIRGNTFTDSGLNANTPYVYSVRNAQGATPQLTVIPGSGSGTTTAPTTSVPTTGPPTTAPPSTGTPSNLHKAGQSADSITIAWTGPAGASYDILRGEAGDKIATVVGNSYTDRGLLANTPYVYSVRGGGVTTGQLTLTTG
jgi:hypothetical protein